MIILHFFLAIAALVTLAGSLWVGSESAQVMIGGFNSPRARWRDIGASITILAVSGCAVITALYALSGAAF